METTSCTNMQPHYATIPRNYLLIENKQSFQFFILIVLKDSASEFLLSTVLFCWIGFFFSNLLVKHIDTLFAEMTFEANCSSDCELMFGNTLTWKRQFIYLVVKEKIITCRCISSTWWITKSFFMLLYVHCVFSCPFFPKAINMRVS